MKKTKDREIAKIAIDGETAFVSISDTIPVETVQEDSNISTKESTHESDEDEEYNGPPSLKERNYDEDSSVDSDEEETIINWKLTEKIPEFQKAYKDEEGQQIKTRQEH